MDLLGISLLLILGDETTDKPKEFVKKL